MLCLLYLFLSPSSVNMPGFLIDRQSYLFPSFLVCFLSFPLFSSGGCFENNILIVDFIITGTFEWRPLNNKDQAIDLSAFWKSFWQSQNGRSPDLTNLVQIGKEKMLSE